MTIGEIETEARSILLDTYDDAYRFEPVEIFRAVKDGMVQARSTRPESCYVNGLYKDLALTIPSTFTTAELTTFRATTLNMEDRWKEALVFYVVFRMYQKDDADTQNMTLSDKYLQMYSATIQS